MKRSGRAKSTPRSWALARYLIFGDDIRANQGMPAASTGTSVRYLAGGFPAEQGFSATPLALTTIRPTRACTTTSGTGNSTNFQFRLAARGRRTDPADLSRQPGPGRSGPGLASLWQPRRGRRSAPPPARRRAGCPAIRSRGNSWEKKAMQRRALSARAGPTSAGRSRRAPTIISSIAPWPPRASRPDFRRRGDLLDRGRRGARRTRRAFTRRSIGLNPAFLPAYQNLAGLIPGMVKAVSTKGGPDAGGAQFFPDEDSFKVAISTRP